MKVVLIVVYLALFPNDPGRMELREEWVPMTSMKECLMMKRQLEYVPLPNNNILVGSYCEEMQDI